MTGLAAAGPQDKTAGVGTRGCRSCHQEKKRKRVYDAVRPWVESRHAAAGGGCTDCHLKRGVEGDFYRAVTSTSKEDADAFMVERPGEGPDKRTCFIEVCGGCHAERPREFRESVHGTARLGNGRGVGCVDCHDPHMAPPVSDADPRLYMGSDLKTCGRCHGGMLASYMKTFHGKQYVPGNPFVPTCTYCHIGHERSADDQASVMHAGNVGRICADCHGEAVAKGASADEMMIHNLSSDSTRKVIHFRDPVRIGPLSIASIINSSYLSMTTGVVGFFTVLSTLDFIKKTRSGEGYRRRKGEWKRTVKRCSLSWRLQHIFWASPYDHGWLRPPVSCARPSCRRYLSASRTSARWSTGSPCRPCCHNRRYEP